MNRPERWFDLKNVSSGGCRVVCVRKQKKKNASFVGKWMVMVATVAAVLNNLIMQFLSGGVRDYDKTETCTLNDYEWLFCKTPSPHFINLVNAPPTSALKHLRPSHFKINQPYLFKYLNCPRNVKFTNLRCASSKHCQTDRAPKKATKIVMEM